ncbi:MAG: UDP-N-acetylmuramate dehydrogenase, partial [Chloroflexi bacterium]|nr:UDP-N-acetylmuramate dehydrogenase [Chloroflexota bacterium]
MFRVNGSLFEQVWIQCPGYRLDTQDHPGPGDTEKGPIYGYLRARVLEPADAEDLSSFLMGLGHEIPVSLIGVGSNMLIRDGGVDGVVIKLGKPFSEITFEGDEVRVGAGALGVTVAYKSAEHCLSGFEFLRGIPGTIGGAIAMNAGAYGSEIKDILKSVSAIDRTGTLHSLDAEALSFSYRYAGIPDGWIIVEATFKGQPEGRTAIESKMEGIRDAREESQPLRTRTGGSTFKNPNADEADGKKAWELIEEAGCRGMRRGGAIVSDKHCNFLINTGLATSADLEALGEEIRERVK